MKNLLLLYEQESTTQKMLCDFLDQFSSRTSFRVIKRKTIMIKKKDVDKSDIIITVRSMNPMETEIVEKAKSAGKVCIAFWDDDLSEEREDIHINKIRRKAMINELRQVDAILSTNEYLASKLSTFGENTKRIIINTAVDIEELSNRKEENEKIKIVYAAGKTHSNDFTVKILRALIDLDRQYPNRIELSFVGVRPNVDMKNVSFPIYFYGLMNMEQYKKHMKDQNYDIGLAPLISNGFTTSKYFNKFIDYTQNNILGIYSNCLPYTLIVKDGINGFLADDSSTSWYDKIETLFTNRELMLSCLDNARELLKDNFSINAISNHFEHDLFNLVDEKKTFQPVKINLYLSKLKYLLFKLIYLPVSYIKVIGIKGTIERLYNYKSSIRLVKKG